MGNHRFKLSDMMPNAWFYKLRDMSKVRSHKKTSSTPHPTNSFYYYAATTDPIRNRMDNNLLRVSPKFFDPPPPTKKRSRRKTIYMPSPSPRKVSIPPPQDAHQIPNSVDDYFEDDPTSSPDCRAMSGFHGSSISSCSCDIIINVDDFDVISEPDLPPIQTKPAGKQRLDVESVVVSNNNASTNFSAEKLLIKRDRRGRKSFSGGVKIGRRPGRRRKSSVKEEKKGALLYSESFAIVKASFDPEKDFRESMMEMIVENEIKAAKDLEELLASYLSLNSLHYHHLIIKAFEQIWFTINQLHL